MLGLDYAKNRYSSYTLGRFLTPDPYIANNGSSGNPTDPGSWNRYAYAGGDPANFVDPLGLFYGPAGPGGSGGTGSSGGSTFDPSLWRFVIHFSPSPMTPRSQPLNVYKTALNLKKAVKTGEETDCQALADFADAIAGAMGDDPGLSGIL